MVSPFHSILSLGQNSLSSGVSLRTCSPFFMSEIKTLPDGRVEWTPQAPWYPEYESCRCVSYHATRFGSDGELTHDQETCTHTHHETHLWQTHLCADEWYTWEISGKPRLLSLIVRTQHSHLEIYGDAGTGSRNLHCRPITRPRQVTTWVFSCAELVDTVCHRMTSELPPDNRASAGI